MHGPGEARPLREAATARLTNLRVCRVEAAPVLKFVQDALAKLLEYQDLDVFEVAYFSGSPSRSSRSRVRAGGR
jgi:hypothetical protein